MTSTDPKPNLVGHQRTLNGVVVSNKMQKTVVVEVNRRRQHPKYRKFYTVTTRYQAHAETAYAVGDRVVIGAVRPLSKTKRWAVIGQSERSRTK